MSDVTIQQVNSTIMFGNFDLEQLNSIAMAIKYRRGQLNKEAKRALTVGDTVRFTHPKTGRTHHGSVVKINIKKVQVREGLTTWNVPANMLAAV